MRFYLVRARGHDEHFPTLVRAHRDAKDCRDFMDWRDITIDEVEVATDKANMLRLLNNEGGTHKYLRQWGITQRGGLMPQAREES